MRATRLGGGVIAVALTLGSTVGAISTTVGDKDIERASRLAQSAPDVRARFHAPYIVSVNDPTLERLEVITEYRRYVVTTEEQLRLGHWLFAQTIEGAQQLVRPWRGRVSLTARLRFHPQNTFNTVPAYDLTVGDPDLSALELARTPITALHSGNPRELFAPILGATLDAVFDASAIAGTVRPVRLSLGVQEVARVTIDFSKLE
jgi:hypothetical protein